MIPRTVLTRSGPISVNAVTPINTIQSKSAVNNAGPMKNVINNAYSTARRPFNKITIANNSNFTKKVNTIKGTKVNTARPKAVISAVKGNKRNAVKASGNPQQDLKDKGVIDSGCSRHMTRNKSYLTDYEKIDGGFVAVGGNSKGGEITRKGKFNEKADEGFFVGYSTNSKAFRVFNSRTKIVEENLHVQKHVMMQNSKDSLDAGFKPLREEERKDAEDPGNESGNPTKGKDSEVPKVNAVDPKTSIELPNDPNIPKLEDIVYSDDDEDVVAKAEMNNLDAFMPISPIPTTRIHNDHPVDQIIGDLISAPQTRRMTKNLKDHEEPKKVIQALQDELLQFKLQKVWTLVDLPNRNRAIGTKWVYRNKKDERGIVIKNKVRLVAQGYTQEERIDYDEVFAPVARIEAIRLFLAYASFKDFVVYQMDVKSAFLYGKIEEEVYVCQPPRFEDPDFPDRVYKVEKALYGLHQAPRAWYETLSTYLLENRFQRGQIDKTLFIKRDQGDILIVKVYVDDIIFGSTKKKLCTEFEKMMHKKFQMSSMGELTFFLGLQVKQKEDGIFISQDKYVTEVLKKFSFSNVKTANTPMETHKPLLKDADGEDVDEHMYRSMIGSLMYLTCSRPDIMFAICVCARFQVNPKVSHLHAVKRIFRYLKGQPKLGLWYPKDSPFDLVAYTDSDYAGASLDRKSTIGGCQFLGCRLISWKYKKQTVVANSTTKAEYVAASSCCGQVIWIQNQLLDYGYNFMHTKIYIDNESIICIVKNLVFHSKRKHIEIRHHFIRYSNEKKLIQIIKIHTNKNVADLLTKIFDVMSAPKFADSHNMVAFLAKPTETDGFEQILDFLNANPIKYALTVNLTIYTSCIEQFWATAKVKTVNGEIQLQALVDGKKVIITETCVRRDLQLEDGEGIECLPNADIFEQLALIGMVKNVDSSVKFLIYPRFMQVFLDKQVGDMSTHDEIFVTPSHTKKVFGNMKRIGKGFSRAVTPLFSTMMVQAQEEMGKGSAMPTDPYHTPIIQPSTSQPQKKQSRRKERKDTEISQSSGLTEPIADEASNEENVPTQSNNPHRSRVNTLGNGEDRLTLKELMDLYTKLSDSGRKIDDIDKDAKVTLVDETQGRYDDAQMFDTYVFNGEEVFVTKQSEKVVEEVVSTAEDKGEAKMIEPEKPLKMKEQIRLDEELAFKLQAEEEEEEQARLAIEKAEKVEEANISWDNVQAMIKVDRLLAERLQAREQEELTDEEKARLFVELLEKRKKHFTALRAQEKRNKPPTKAQKKTMTRVNMFVDKDTELVKEISKKAEAEMAQESSSKRAGEELEQEARFGGNEESKKMRKTMLKQQFTEFSVTEEEGLHKGYDRFQKILSQLNQVQARPDNDDINLKFLRALPSSWSQVGLALKTRGGLDSMSFDDLYNKLRSLELDVRIGHSYSVKAAVAPTHSAFIGTTCSGSKPTYF
ncbi:putative ribonuclease H-like domain-containing protein [Tanacetum coccineum]